MSNAVLVEALKAHALSCVSAILLAAKITKGDGTGAFVQVLKDFEKAEQLAKKADTK